VRRRPARKALLLVAALVLAATALARAETIQHRGLRIHIEGEIAPVRLPRAGLAPVRVSVGTRIAATDGKAPPALRQISIAINRHGRLDSSGLPVCEMADIQPATNEKAMEACRGSFVGEGRFEATTAVTRQVSFPAKGKMLAFNGTFQGRPAILAHVYGTDPVPTSFTLPFVIARSSGTFGTTITATVPKGEASSITLLDLSLDRRFTYRGRGRSYVSAGCPAPVGFSKVVFPFARVSYRFVGSRELSSTLMRSCRAGP
jgi:hypothetical protein